MRLIVTPTHLICGKKQNEKLQVIFLKNSVKKYFNLRF